MAVKLVIVDHQCPEEPIVQEWDQSLITLGRSKSCNVELNDPEISRRHVLIKYIDNAYYVIDEESRHGTLLDGKPLAPHEPYELSKEHLIELPGYTIKISLDGHQPKLERTSVQTRQLLDELLQEEARPRVCPCLESVDGRYLFQFSDDKASFVLGSSLDGDFVVFNESISKKHVSFARDINGIRMIPLPNHPVSLNGQDTKDSVILADGARIQIFDLEFLFYEHGRKTKTMPTASLVEKSGYQPPTISAKKSSNVQRFTTLDRIFVLSFIVVVTLASFVVYEII